MLGRGLNSLIPDKSGLNSQNNPLGEEINSSFSNQNNYPAKNPAVFQNQDQVSQSVNQSIIQPETNPSLPNEGKKEINNSYLVEEEKLLEPVKPEIKSSLTEEKEKNSFSNHIFFLEIEKIKPNPFQPRRYFDETALKELSSSIREFGVIQPLVVTKNEIETPTGTDVEYELIAGERRLLASKMAGLERVPAIIKGVTPKKEKLEMAVIENLQRENLNPIETARAFSRLQDEYAMTQREIASRLGKSREVVANTIRLLSLPSQMQEAVEKGQISESQARLLLSISDITVQQNLFNEILRNSLSVRELRNRIISINARANAVERFSEVDPEIKYIQERLAEILGAKVRVEKSGDSGKITISFNSSEELKGIIEKVVKEKL